MDELSFCLLTTFYPPDGFGGDAVNVQRLARGLARRGHRVRVVHSPAAYRALGGSAASTGTDVAAPDGVEVVAAPTGAATTLATYLSGQPLGYRRRLAALVGGFDVVHFHNPSLIGGPGALGLGDAVRLYTTHEHWLVCPTHVLFRNEREVCTKRTCVSCTIRHGRPPQPWRATPMLERGVRQVDALLCPSRFTAEIHREHFPDARIEVLPLPAPDPGPERARPPAPERPTFLYAGRLERIKGVDRLVDAFPAVEGADLVVAGDGSLAGPLARAASRHPQIRFVGRRSQEEVLELCRTATALVVPSAGYETFGGVAVEAMAVGTPVVVRNLGALPELVAHGGGRLFDGDADMVAVLQGLVDDPEVRAILGREARAVAQEHYGEGRFFRRYFELVGELASERGRSPLAERALRAADAEALDR